MLKNKLITFKDVKKSELDEWWEDIGGALDPKNYSEGSSLVHCEELEDLENDFSGIDSLLDFEDFYFYVNGSGMTHGEEFGAWLVRNKELEEPLLRGIIDSFVFGLGALPYVPTNEAEFILAVKNGKIYVLKDNLPEEYSKSYKEVSCNYDKDCTLHFFKDSEGYWNVEVSYDYLLLETTEDVLDFIQGGTFETSVRYGAPVISKNGVTVKVKIITDGYKPYGMTEHILREIYGTSLYDREADFSNDLFKGLDRQTLTTRLTRSAVLWDSSSNKDTELGIVYSIKDLSYNRSNNELKTVVNVSIEYPTSETLGYLYIEHHKPVDFNSEVVNLGVRGSIFAHLDYFGYPCIGALQGFYFPKKFSDGKSIEVSDHIGWQLTKGGWKDVSAKDNYKEILAEIAENHLKPLKFEDKFEYYDYKEKQAGRMNLTEDILLPDVVGEYLGFEGILGTKDPEDEDGGLYTLGVRFHDSGNEELMFYIYARTKKHRDANILPLDSIKGLPDEFYTWLNSRPESSQLTPNSSSKGIQLTEDNLEEVYDKLIKGGFVVKVNFVDCSITYSSDEEIISVGLGDYVDL